jgi:hypothetical protein
VTHPDDNVTSVLVNINVHRFSFENTNSPGYWSLEQVRVQMQNEQFVVSDVKIGAPLGFSYHCTQEVVFNADDNELNINNGFQVRYSFLHIILE